MIVGIPNMAQIKLLRHLTDFPQCPHPRTCARAAADSDAPELRFCFYQQETCA